MKKIILFYILIYSISSLFSQNRIDSLRNILARINDDTAKINILIKLAKEYNQSSKYSEAEKSAQYAINLSRNIEYPKGLAEGTRSKGVALFWKGNFSSAVKELKSAQKIFEKINDFEGVAGTLNNIALIYYREGAYNTAIRNLLEVIRIHESKIKVDFIGPVYNNLGAIYQDIREYDKALYYFNLALNPAINKENFIASSMMNIADIYIEQYKYHDALELLQRANNILIKYQNKASQQAVLYLRAQALTGLKKYDEAIELTQKSLEERLKLSEQSGIVESLNQLAELNFLIKNFPLSENYLNKAISEGKKIKYNPELVVSYKIYSKLDSARGNFSSAFEWYKKYNELSDSLLNERVNKDIKLSETEFIIAQKEDELLKARLDAQKEKEVNQRYLFGSLIIVIIVFMILAWNYREKKQKEKHNKELELKIIERTKQLQEALEKSKETEKLKTAFLSQMSHEIRTPLTNIINLASLLVSEHKYMKESEAQSVFNGITSSGKRIIRTIELILNYAEVSTNTYKPNFKELKLSEIIRKIENELKPAYKDKGLEFLFIPCENDKIIGDEYSVTSMLKHIIENAIIFTVDGEIEIRLYRNNDLLIFECKDSGIGISEDHKINMFTPFMQEEKGYGRTYDGVGLGLPLTRKYCELNNVELNFASEKGKGTIFTIRFNSK